jgi:hypothetical protein
MPTTKVIVVMRPPESSEQINNRLELTLYFVLLC